MVCAYWGLFQIVIMTLIIGSNSAYHQGGPRRRKPGVRQRRHRKGGSGGLQMQSYRNPKSGWWCTWNRNAFSSDVLLHATTEERWPYWSAGAHAAPLPADGRYLETSTSARRPDRSGRNERQDILCIPGTGGALSHLCRRSCELISTGKGTKCRPRL
jgi:hypothetical protein